MMGEKHKESPLKSPEMERFNPHSLAVVTTTFYKDWYSGEENREKKDLVVDKVRGDLATETLKAATEAGYQVVVVDASNNHAFTTELKKLGIDPLKETQRGMSPSRQQGFRAASKLSGVETICWLEPEKVSFIKDCLLIAIAPIVRGEADIVIGNRNRELLRKYYPEYQIEFEERANMAFTRLLKNAGIVGSDFPVLDYWSGPRIYRNTKRIVEIFCTQHELNSNINDPHEKKTKNPKYVRKIVPDEWSDALFLPIIAALHQKDRVVGVEVPYVHPEGQTSIEIDSKNMRNKRKYQYQTILVTAYAFIQYLLEKPSALRRKPHHN